MARARPKPSLKARALLWLAQREHSRSELRRKLLRQVRLDAQAAAGEAGDNAGVALAVDSLLDWLEAHDHLSQSRFVESRVHARATRFGNLRIRQELAQHAVELQVETQRELDATEFERARSVWARKFGAAAADAAARARQMRFLAGRGFSPAVIRRVIRGAEGDTD